MFLEYQITIYKRSLWHVIPNKCHNKECYFHVVWTWGLWYQFIDINSYIIRISEILYLITKYKKYVKYVSFIRCIKNHVNYVSKNDMNIKMALEYQINIKMISKLPGRTKTFGANLPSYQHSLFLFPTFPLFLATK